TIRQELRLPVDVRGSMMVSGSTHAIRVRLIDMSQSGLGLVVSKAISEGTFVALALEHGTAFGEIRTCESHSRRTFRVGFWLEEFIPHSAASGVNAHLWGFAWALRVVKKICATLHLRNASRCSSRRQSRAAC
ncbi:MAG TPA: PilZ domain-containing protein, partial [Bryobacteraceae bacterium]